MPGAHIFSSGDFVMRHRKKLFWLLGVGTAAIYLLIFPQQCAHSVREGLRLCTERIVPALFPYLVLSNLFLSGGGAQSMGRRLGALMQRVFHVGSGGVIALLLGLTGGYPLGAKTAAALCREGSIAKRDAQQLLLFCNNAGPAFAFGVVGGVCYRSAAVGAALYGVHLLSALLCGILLRGSMPVRDADQELKPLPSFSEAFLSSVQDAGRTLMNICLLITVFTVLIGSVKQFLPGKGNLQLLVSVVLELSSGCFAVASSSLPWCAKLSLTAAAIGWGGVCVHLQTMASVKDAGLTIRPYLLAKALQATLSAALALPLSLLIEPVAQVFGTGIVLRPFSPLPWTIFSIGMTFLIFLQFTTSNSENKGL